MLTDPKLRSQVDLLWYKFWTGGLTNPLDAIEQFSYPLFLKRLDDAENARERQSKRRGVAEAKIPAEMRWGQWTKHEAARAREAAAQEPLCEWIWQGKLSHQEFLSAEFPLEQIQAAFALSSTGKTLKTMVRF
jgi:hypothetical protein